MDLFVTHAATLAHDVTAAESSRAFCSAVHQFEDLLSRLSNYPPDFFAEGDARALATIADTVVHRIGVPPRCASRSRHRQARARAADPSGPPRREEHLCGPGGCD